ncbi:MAG: ABC transporter permease [Caldilineaceae bacterium]|nr:ABC transporter permease [Caldilineaceae bacterium]
MRKSLSHSAFSPGLPQTASAWRARRARAGLAAREPGRDLPRPTPRLIWTPSFRIGATVVALLLAIAIAAPLLAPFAPEQVGAGTPLQPPSALHLFGTDPLGRDLYSRVLHGTRLALAMAAGGVLLAAAIGVPLGLCAGFYGRRVDYLLSRLAEVWMAFPGLLLALIIVARLGPSLTNTALALGIVGVPSYFRLARNATLSAKQQPYIEAAHALGLSSRRILLRHILPNTAPSLIVLASMRMGMLLLAGGGLSFIGLGAQPPLPEWGALLAAGRDYMDSAPWLALYPGLFLTITVIAFNLLGDGLRDALDPMQRGER